jgi:hypothetical protein
VRKAIKALIVANHFLETELEKLRAVAKPAPDQKPRVSRPGLSQ